MKQTAVAPFLAEGPTAGTPQPVLVLLGGVPGAGKTTLLAGVSEHRPGVRAVDPEGLRNWFAERLPRALPYRCYRWLVHALNALHTLFVLLTGPGHSRTRVVIHDPATRPRRRRLTAVLARWRGWQPVLVVLDVPRATALAGQRQRGRVVARRSFDKHWARWQRQRDALVATAHGERDPEPWAKVMVVRRDDAQVALAHLLT